jgi:hypothetical protein
MESLGAITPGFGYVLGAVITALRSPRAAYAAAGAGLLVLVVLAAVLQARGVTRRRPTETAAA